jgi:acyl carrier protein
MANIREKLVDILAEYKNVDPSEIKTDLPFTELGLDSLDVAELVMQIEDDLGVSLEMSAQYNTIDKLAAYIEQQ